MPTRHRVQPGECLSSIAFRYGFFPDTIWMHDENRALREKRPNANTLVPDEDEVYIPDKTAHSRSCATGKRHVFRRRAVPEMLRVRLLDEEDQPRAGLAYRIEIDGVSTSGTTDGEGMVAHPISPDAKTAILIIGEGAKEERYGLMLGSLPPIDTVEGAVERLANLGYDTSDEPLALRQFQADYALEITGELDDATYAKLEDLHRS